MVASVEGRGRLPRRFRQAHNDYAPVHGILLARVPRSSDDLVQESSCDLSG